MLPGMSHLKTIQERIKHANKQHPEGADFDALTNEILEVREALKNEDKKQIIYELYDVIAVCLRMVFQYEKDK